MAQDDEPAGGGPPEGAEPPRAPSRLSRRSFLAVTGTLATAAVVPGCTTDRAVRPGPQEGPSAVPQPGVRVPEATGAGTARFLNPDQYELVEAIAARIIPGDDGDPGAVEAGCADYIDRLLATHEGYPQRTYVSGPFAMPYEGDEPPPDEDGVVWVPEDELERYGWQSGRPPRELYEMGLARFQELVAERHDGASFVELDEDEQDALLEAIEDDEDDDVGEIFEPIAAGTFFGLIHGHVIEGFLADPMYGGNRDLAGWRLIGFPGAQRAYSPQEMVDPDFHRSPQSLAMLPMLHGAHRGDTAALGSVRRRHPNGPID